MAKDPALLWYWSDWRGGTGTFTRHLKGCYMDLLDAQFNSGPLSIDEIRIVLGADFGQVWPTLQKKFTVTDTGLFYNKRMEEEKEKRRKFTESRRNNLASQKKIPHMDNHMNDHKGDHMENANANKNINGAPADFRSIGLIPDMVSAFIEVFPQYPSDPENDFPACLAIARKIAAARKWDDHRMLNEGRFEVLRYWREVVDYASTDDWYSKQSISMLLKKWQDLIQSKTQSGNKQQPVSKAEGSVGAQIKAARNKQA